MQIFNGVKVHTPAGAPKDIQRLVLKPLHCYLGCVLWVTVVLKGESLPQSEVFCTLFGFQSHHGITWMPSLWWMSCLAFSPKSSILVSSHLRISHLASRSPSPLSAAGKTPGGASYTFYSREASVKKRDWWTAADVAVLLAHPPISTCEIWRTVSVILHVYPNIYKMYSL